ncbi:NUDIX hydrolase [Actinophytocola sp.]|uniref:NUDIX hydrolase n=1 Tax=Actinophytocola sp. TaxID=1872138 RepID=UPI002D803EEB|nr:NUDIX domain-containing protein [Actinophytocola sp.]HET9140786.1 NUDIX domain-containing protein [Actinophytocola sp.]
MTTILAAGAVLWRRGAPGGLEIALVHRPRYDDWSLPKGKLEPGETLWAGAAREVAEETGFASALGRYLGQVDYRVLRPLLARKTVHYVAARARSGQFRPNREVDELAWVPPEAAGGLLSYARDAAVVREFTALPADTTTMLLVRHAKAGSRAQWPGPDELRPLSARGWAQVKAVREFAGLFAADRVHSPALLRCVQTVQQAAEDIGTEMVEEPLLSEQGYRADPAAGVARLREIALAGGTPMVCSQGGVIPDLLSRLAAESGLDLAEPASRKGSVWLLSFRPAPDGRLVAATYIAEP